MDKNSTKNVSTGAPKLGGYAYKAALGTTLPTDAVTALANEFKCLGFISEDGITNDNSPSSKDIKDWSGVTVISVQEEKKDTWKCILIESKNIAVLETVYGKENVTGTIEAGITVKANNADLPYEAYVFEMVMSEGDKKRVVLPQAKVTEVGSIKYTKSDAVGYEITLTCIADEDGNTHYEYIKAK